MLVATGVAIAAITVACMYFALQAPQLRTQENTDLVLSNVTIWNPGEDPQSSQTISISDGLITKISPTKKGDPTSLCDVCFVMPGLVDAHVHMPPGLAIGNQELFSLLFLRHSVTAVRDVGQFDDSLNKLQTRIRNGEVIGPRIYRCGRILDGHPLSVPGAIAVENEEQGRKSVRDHFNNGVDCIKIYGNLSRDAYRGVAEEASIRDLPLLGHMPRALSITDVSNFEIQHYTGIPYLNKPAPKNWAYKSRDLIDMDAEEIANVIAVMKTNHVSFLPTNANLLSRLTASDRERFPPSPGLVNLPTFWERAWPSIVSHPETDEEIATELDALPYGLRFIRAAHKSGIDVLVGTDVVMPYVVPGESMHQQLALLTDAFGSSETALRAATFVNGKHIDHGKIGRLQVGAYADLLIFRDGPPKSIKGLSDYEYVIADGRLYHRDDLEAAVQKYRRHFRGGFYTSVMNGAYNYLSSDYEESEISRRTVE